MKKIKKICFLTLIFLLCGCSVDYKLVINTDSSVNRVEYMLIIKKGISYLEKNNIKFDEILEVLKK